jgi:hypothetical protein
VMAMIGSWVAGWGWRALPSECVCMCVSVCVCMCVSECVCVCVCVRA